jgi:hypothetical protein
VSCPGVRKIARGGAEASADTEVGRDSVPASRGEPWGARSPRPKDPPRESRPTSVSADPSAFADRPASAGPSITTSPTFASAAKVVAIASSSTPNNSCAPPTSSSSGRNTWPAAFVGVYTESESGLRVLLDNSGESEGPAGWNWTDIGAFAASAGRVLFVATQTDGTSFRRGLFLWTGEDFEELAFLGAGSAERPVPAGFADVFLDGDRLGFIGTQPPGTGDLTWAQPSGGGWHFTDGSQGIYLYQGSPLEIPTLGTWALAVFAVALMALGAGLLRR